jgi:hypothetical protein
MLMKSREIDIFENLNLARLPIPPRGQPWFATLPEYTLNASI